MIELFLFVGYFLTVCNKMGDFKQKIIHENVLVVCGNFYISLANIASFLRFSIETTISANF